MPRLPGPGAVVGTSTGITGLGDGMLTIPHAPKTFRQRLKAQQPKCKQYGQRATATQRGYGYRWQRARLAFLRSHPLCVRCQANGETVAAGVVDHITPHRGDMVMFWAHNNWQALCKRCHDRKTAAEDGGGWQRTQVQGRGSDTEGTG